MKSRDALMGGTASSGAAIPGARIGAGGALLHSIHQSATEAYNQINSLYQRLDELTSLQDRLAEKSTQVYELTLSMRFVALSTTIKAAKLGEEGRGLEVIARYLSDASARTSVEVKALTERIKAIATELHVVIFNLAGARLQLEMMRFFARELLSLEAGDVEPAEPAGASRQSMIRGLQQAFHATMVRAVDDLGTCGRHLAGLNVVADQLRRTILTLHVAQMGGKVEASRIRGDDSIMAVLTEIHTFIDSTARELGEIEDITGRFTLLIRAVPAIAGAISLSMTRIERDVLQLSCKASRPGPAPAVVVAGSGGAGNATISLRHGDGATEEPVLVP